MGLVVSATASCGDIFGLRSSPPPPPPTATPAASSPPPTADTTPEPELVRVFRQFDTNGDGLLSVDEVSASFRCSTADAEGIVDAVDLDGDGFISLEELVALFKDGDQSDTLRAAFAAFDENGDGVITAEELRRALRGLGIVGEEMTAEQCAEIVKAVDRDGDGVISFDEFKAMLSTKPAAA